jgi:cytochrome b561
VSLTQTSPRYSAPAQLFHWLSALLIGLAWLLGQLHGKFPEGGPRSLAGFAHITAGQVILILLLLRVLWRFVSPPPAKEASPASVWGDRIAALTQSLLYLLILAIPVVGVLTVFAHGKPLPLFGLGAIPSPWVKDKEFGHKLMEVHEWLANGLILLVILHAGAALGHHFRLKDDTLKRMLPKWVG